MSKQIPIIAIFRKLIPAVLKTAKAMRKDSPGGKRLTPEEIAEISLVLAGEIVAVLETF